MDEWIQANLFCASTRPFFVPKIILGAIKMKKIDEKLAAEISLKKPAVSNSRLNRHTIIAG